MRRRRAHVWQGSAGSWCPPQRRHISSSNMIRAAPPRARPGAPSGASRSRLVPSSRGVRRGRFPQVTGAPPNRSPFLGRGRSPTDDGERQRPRRSGRAGGHVGGGRYRGRALVGATGGTGSRSGRSDRRGGARVGERGSRARSVGHEGGGVPGWGRADEGAARGRAGRRVRRRCGARKRAGATPPYPGRRGCRGRRAPRRGRTSTRPGSVCTPAGAAGSSARRPPRRPRAG